MSNQYRDTTIGGAPSMPSSDGRPIKEAVCYCADCHFKGAFASAVAHYQDTGHSLRYKGHVQDFSKFPRMR